MKRKESVVFAMKRRGSWLLIIGAFIFLYFLNWLMPLAFGDDYLYAFIWQGNPMYVPLTEDAVRISSLQELLSSQIAFYYTWSGRVVNNTLSQLFVWAGKDIFNFFNALASVLLVLEIYWCSNKGRITFNFNTSRLAWVFLFFWLFTPSFPSVVFWLVGACHYLWPAVFLIGFLIPFIYKYYFSDIEVERNRWFGFGMFFFGIMAGCTNENSVCWVILLLLIFILKNRKLQAVESWMYTGVAGLALGYAALMFSPGNFARLVATHGNGWFNQAKLLENLHIFALVLVIQLLLWHFCLRSLPRIYHTLPTCTETERAELRKDLILIKTLSIIALGMSVIMLFSPEFHLRSAFPGTVQLMIVTSIILRIQKDYSIELLRQNVKKFLTYTSVIFLVVSAGFTLQHLYDHYVYNEKLLSHVAALKRNGSDMQSILYVEPFPEPSKIKDLLSGKHAFNMNVTEEPNSWINVAFARYYGIKGVCLLNTKKEDVVPEAGVK